MTSTGEAVQCPTGCKACQVTTTGTITCTTADTGYSLVGGVLSVCNTNCKTCSGPTSSDCTSCDAGLALGGGQCTNCSDPNALSCLATNAAWSVLCVQGFSAAYYLLNGTATGGGFCYTCSLYCSKCDQGGPDTCDDGECFVGYVKVVGTSNCTACFGGCPKCSTSDLNFC